MAKTILVSMSGLMSLMFVWLVWRMLFAQQRILVNGEVADKEIKTTSINFNFFIPKAGPAVSVADSSKRVCSVCGRRKEITRCWKCWYRQRKATGEPYLTAGVNAMVLSNN